jgi:hypothetical protein
MTINVEYPTVETKTTMLKKDNVYNPWYPERNEDRVVTVSLPVNQEHKIYVRKTERLVQEEFMTSEDYCKEQTGMSPKSYQDKHKKAWND